MKILESKTLLMLNKEDLEQIIKDAVKEVVSNKNENEGEGRNNVGDYIPQTEVMKILNRKTTWFHNKRKTGELPAIKSGNQWWYKKEDIEEFVKNGRVSILNKFNN